MGIIKVKKMNFNGGHEPLISPDLFLTVQAILRGNTNQKVKKHDFKFKKLIICKGCGYSIIAETQKGHVYYRCHTKACPTKGMREVTLDNLLRKQLQAAQLMPEETVLLDELLQETEREWADKQKELLNGLKLQTGQIEQKIERLTDCYVEGGLDKETYEQRKEKLLFESKAKQAAERELMEDRPALLMKAKKFLELAQHLVKSYETGNPEEQRELLQIATSNLVVEGKKLMISMKSPFMELANRHCFSFGALKRDAGRKHDTKIANMAKSYSGALKRDAGRKHDTKIANMAKSYSGALERDACRKHHTTFTYSDTNTSPIIGDPLTKEQLKPLLDLILSTVAELPDINEDTDHVV